MDLPHGSGYNAAVEGFREEEYPMLRGTLALLLQKKSSSVMISWLI